MVLFSVFAMNPVPGTAGFGIPVFSDQSSYYVQVCHDGKITDFEEVKISDGERHFVIPRMMFCIGDLETFAFFLDAEDVLFGSRAAIATSIAEVLDSFHDRPFLLMDISDFLGDERLQAQAYEAIERISDIVHRASNLEDWRDIESSASRTVSDDLPSPANFLDEEPTPYRNLISSANVAFDSRLITPTIKLESETDRNATAVAAPLERGFGLTIGTALRRVLLSSLQGAAITSVQIDNVLHEFSKVAGVREDVTDVILNLKGVNIRMEVKGPKRLLISAKGPGVVVAGDISESAGIEVLNRDHVICHLDAGADLFMELTVNRGEGYVSADMNKPEDAPIGLIPIDAIFSPVRKVSYDVQPTRAGQVLDYDKLTMKIQTNGSISPRTALAQASMILSDQISHFANVEELGSAIHEDSKVGAQINSLLAEKVEELELSIRSANCLKNGNIIYVKDLVEKSEAELLRVPNFGRKSLNEIREVLSGMGLYLGMDVSEKKASKTDQVGSNS